MSKLVDDLVNNGYLKNPVITEAFSAINRDKFVPEEFQNVSEANVPLPIGHGQTNSQPLTVAIMMELLDPKRGQNVLDVGSGSGWTTAILSHVVGQEGKVTAIERIESLYEIGMENANKFGFVKEGIAEFHKGDGSKGYAYNAPYDRILVSAEADVIPEELKKQLKMGGKMVIPVGSSVLYLEKKGENDFFKKEYPGFSFVPLVEKK